MNVKIEFVDSIIETSVPIIKLTKSKNGKTGTATFVFIEPIALNFVNSPHFVINGLSLIWENKKIVTNEINIIFKQGKPFLIQGIFIFKNSKEWFNFLSFMNCYSKETGLSFSETNTSSN